MSIGKIIGLSILGIVVIGGAYLWFTEVGPEVQRLRQLQEDYENQPSYEERINAQFSSMEDCEGVTSSSLPEVQDRCMQITLFLNPQLTP